MLKLEKKMKSCSRRWIRRLSNIAAATGLLVAIGATQSPSAQAALIVGTDSVIRALARESGGGGTTDVRALDSNPSGIVSATRGANESSASYSVDGSGFSMVFDHTRGELQTGQPILPLVNTTVELFFTVDEPGTYVLDGQFDFVDPVGKRAYLQVFIQDLTGGATPYNKFEENQAATNESFRVDMNFTGALIGSLVPGNEYRLWVQALSSDTLGSAPSTSTGSGSFSLTVIPEPSTAMLVAIGVAALGASRRHARRDR